MSTLLNTQNPEAPTFQTEELQITVLGGVKLGGLDKRGFGHVFYKGLGVLLSAFAESVPVHGGDLGEGSDLLTSIEVGGEVYIYNKHLSEEDRDKEIERQQKLREELNSLDDTKEAEGN